MLQLRFQGVDFAARVETSGFRVNSAWSSASRGLGLRAPRRLGVTVFKTQGALGWRF